MKKILIFQWFECNSAFRKQELVECIEHNLSLGFDDVIIFNDSIEPMFTGVNVTNVETRSRLTYRAFVDIINEPKNFGAMVCLTNTDIKLDRKIFDLSPVLHPNVLFSISRMKPMGNWLRRHGVRKTHGSRYRSPYIKACCCNRLSRSVCLAVRIDSRSCSSV